MCVFVYKAFYKFKGQIAGRNWAVHVVQDRVIDRFDSLCACTSASS
jgi:hypothetical protein